MKQLLSAKRLSTHIHIIRGQKVMLSTDLATLYEVEPRALVQAVKRNAERFPGDFCFQLSREESRLLKSQSVISSWGGVRRATPYAFTDYGVVMLSSVLRSKRAAEINIAVARAFVRLREMLAGNRDLARRLKELEKKYDAHFRVVFQAIEQLMTEPEATERRRIGFLPPSDSTQGLRRWQRQLPPSRR